jgi:hypothetical protein
MSVFGPTNIVKILNRKLGNSCNGKLNKISIFGGKIDKFFYSKKLVEIN